MRTVLLLWGGMLLTFSQLSAQPATQTVINATGHSYTGGFYQVDWSIGEAALVTEMRSGDGRFVLTNGFLQSVESGKPTSNQQFSADEIRVLPNYTDDKVEVSLLTRQQGKVMLQVYDAMGKAVYRKTLVSYGAGHVERMALRPLAAGTYILKIDLIPAPSSVPKTGSYKIVKY